MRSRFAAWLVTGPAGHLCAGLADWVELLVAWLRSRRARRPRESARARSGR